ncbi:hypothetical protein AB6A40_008769 [Gnathostoma spinigerum]|uniref:Uncharacterized protein n=1 Tax=Gnathostoma spinigerum TaxID=75299 RepID=A0ABD6ER93_9BILA
MVHHHCNYGVFNRKCQISDRIEVSNDKVGSTDDVGNIDLKKPLEGRKSNCQPREIAYKTEKTAISGGQMAGKSSESIGTESTTQIGEDILLESDETSNSRNETTADTNLT